MYYYPESKTSKAVWVLDALAHSNPNTQAGVFWGLGGRNFDEVKRHQAQNIPFYFTDMPYWGRWMGDNRSECYWRVIPNSLHCNWVNDYPSDRFNKLKVQVKDWRTKGDHILVCPSSNTINRFYNCDNWLNDTVTELRKYTDRPIKIRNKPRGNGTSGPRAATIRFEEDIQNAWAVVTLVSIAGVEAACYGIPVFCSSDSPCAPIGNTSLATIETPTLSDRTAWLNTLAYHQYTEDELKNLHDTFLR